MLCTIRNVTAAAAVALALSACGSDKAVESDTTATSTSSTTTTTAAPTSAAASVDEQQIRDLVAAQAEAFTAGDWDALAELTCSKYREQAGDPGQFLVPPIAMFGSPEQLATLTVPQVSTLLSKQFGGGVSPATIDRISQAIVDYDEPTYRAAMLDAVTESTTMTVDKVDNIKIAGDTATADITSTRVMGNKPPQSSTNATPYVREGGTWLDCTDPAGS